MNPSAALWFGWETTKVAKPIKVQLAQGNVKPSNEVVLGVVLEFGEPKFKENFTMCELNNIEAILGNTFLDAYWIGGKVPHEPRVGTWDGKMFFPLYTCK